MSAAQVSRILAYGLLLGSAGWILQANDVTIPAPAKVAVIIGAVLLMAAETRTGGSG